MNKTVTGILALTIALFVSVTMALAEKRVALVIGNSSYKHVSSLANPKNDAVDMAKALEELGFQVHRASDLGRHAMQDTLSQFSDIATGADMAVIFYAGHGIGIDKRNYLIPVDAKLSTDRKVKFETISLDTVLSSLDGVKGIKMVLLDACRNNPFTTKMTVTSASRSVARGLSSVEPSRGTLIGFSAKDGSTAEDGAGRNSPYTTALLKNLSEPGLELQFLFRKVRDEVLAATGGGQEPFTYGSLPGQEIFLKAAELKTVTKPAVNDLAIELAYWNAIKDSSEPAIVRSYIDKYPKGQFVILADALLARLKGESAGQASVQEETKPSANLRAKPSVGQTEELAAWQAVRRSNDPAELKAYIARYPNGTFHDFAKARLEAVEQTNVAALQKPASQPEKQSQVDPVLSKHPKLSQRELALEIQKNLVRLGCNPGKPDGKWGAKSKRALKSYVRHSKQQFTSFQPSPTILGMLVSHTARVCPPPSYLTSAQIVSVHAGKCVTYWGKGNGTQCYRANGNATYNDKKWGKDTGKWRVKGDLLCEKWSDDPKEKCERVRSLGNGKYTSSRGFTWRIHK